jgi:hypothetical protein
MLNLRDRELLKQKPHPILSCLVKGYLALALLHDHLDKSRRVHSGHRRTAFEFG